MHKTHRFDPPDLKGALLAFARRDGILSGREISPEVLEWLQDREMVKLDESDPDDVRISLLTIGWSNVYYRCRADLTIDTLNPPDRTMARHVVDHVARELPDALEIWFSGQRAEDNPGPYQRCVMGISKHSEDRWSEAGERISQLLLGAGTSAPSAPSYAAVTQTAAEARARLPQRRTAR